jgi:hypothetical protein
MYRIVDSKTLKPELQFARYEVMRNIQIPNSVCGFRFAEVDIGSKAHSLREEVLKSPLSETRCKKKQPLTSRPMMYFRNQSE